MKWTKFTLNTTTEATDYVSNMLDELGIEGIEIIDNIPLSEEDKKAMFIDILPELDEDNGTATISFYIDPEVETQELIAKVKEGLEEIKAFVNIGDATIDISETEDKDWINNWKEFFKPFRIDEDIIIKPTWEKLDQVNEGDIVIEIDPGTAFGTGSHETTKLCILGLKKHLKKNSLVLDVGCGSGILSIIGLKLGAKKVIATDIDANALTATYENVSGNGIKDDEFIAYSGNIIEDESLQEKVGVGIYDIVVANILADIIIPLSAEIGKHMKPNGLFISSGIINMKKEEVVQAILQNGFEIIEINEMGDWVSIVARKPE
ncbi:50S ribosomal protein L11 methyltransferase [Anaeromicropila herbilytica]|uniref:Ribosomal protein L11 methyltransferase n=1 Tax=Anaeromicropila herbilytica TaxID=2785025 RepID=A0A7R7EMW5_9FIRM|nr:50S ribosomal protein L11 methyltransferase [Anaeromicropila herbilytica]BCN31723.1 ribosomal protein L11 methyltransferase [Anaeromicropila herbilytica]